jgi:hypothetical protein
MASFAQLASVTASTKRGGGIDVNGLEIAYTTNIASLKCLPLDPVSPELGQGIEGLAFKEILQTTVEGGLDIIEGDILVVGSNEYPIRAVGEWTWPPDGLDYLMLTLEDRK